LATGRKAELDLFRPLLYIVDSKSVEDRIMPVETGKKAALDAEEYLIHDLHSDEFDYIDFKDVVY